MKFTNRHLIFSRKQLQMYNLTKKRIAERGCGIVFEGTGL